MIRINLLPIKAAKKREAGQRQLVLMGVVLGGAVAGVVVFHSVLASEVGELESRNGGRREAIEKLKGEVGDLDKLKADLQELREQEKTIAKLEMGKAGPALVLRELSEILTRNKGPCFDKAGYEEMIRTNPNAGYNPGWDPRRVWVTAFKELEGELALEGGAKSNDDVAEFLKRLDLSEFFGDVVLEETQQAVDTETRLKYMKFSLTCRVKY
jgi:type IV pilus assembly protein PilN